MVDLPDGFTFQIPSTFESIIITSIKGDEDVVKIYVMPAVPDGHFPFITQAQTIRIISASLVVNELAFVFCSTFL